jgi:hypothetical protein
MSIGVLARVPFLDRFFQDIGNNAFAVKFRQALIVAPSRHAVRKNKNFRHNL